MATAVFFVTWILLSVGFIKLTTRASDKTGGPEAALFLSIFFFWVPAAILAAYLNVTYFKALGW